MDSEIPLPAGIMNYDALTIDSRVKLVRASCTKCQFKTGNLKAEGWVCGDIFEELLKVMAKSKFIPNWENLWFKITEILMLTKNEYETETFDAGGDKTIEGGINYDYEIILDGPRKIYQLFLFYDGESNKGRQDQKEILVVPA